MKLMNALIYSGENVRNLKLISCSWKKINLKSLSLEYTSWLQTSYHRLPKELKWITHLISAMWILKTHYQCAKLAVEPFYSNQSTRLCIILKFLSLDCWYKKRFSFLVEVFDSNYDIKQSVTNVYTIQYVWDNNVVEICLGISTNW